LAGLQSSCNILTQSFKDATLFPYLDTMKAKLIVFILLSTKLAFSQSVIYNDASTIVTGFWTGSLNITEVTTNMPSEGNNHYSINYNSEAYWSGVGMNLDNWGSSTSYDFSNYNTMKIAYRGMNGNHRLTVKLRNPDGTYSNDVVIGGATSTYQTIEIPFIEFYAGLIEPFDFSDISEVSLSITSGADPYSGTVYVDDIGLIQKDFTSFSSTENWAHFAKMGKGVNLTNWLDAYWEIPFGTYPNASRYNRPRVQSLVDLGFESIRLPITFERIADFNPPYQIDPNHPTWELIDSLILFAEEMDFSLIIDNHHGFDFDDQTYEQEIPRKQAIWNQIMTRYANLDCNRYFFELYNEARGVSNANLRIVMDSIISQVRSFNTCHSLIIGANGFNSSGGLLRTQPYQDDNIIYTFHSYDPYFFTHQGMNWTDPPEFPAIEFPLGNDSINLVSLIKQVNDWSEFYGQPAMLGEFGVSNEASDLSRCNYISTIAKEFWKYGMPWYYWDVFSTSDGFGFTDGVTMPDCFADELRIGNGNQCDLIVSNITNNGIGSLREQINCAMDGDTISFDLSLSLDTLRLQHSPIIIDKNITIFNNLNTDIIYQSNDMQSFLLIDQNKTVNINGIDFSDFPNPTLQNIGTLRLDNCTINYETSDFKLNTGGLYIIGENVLISN